MAREYTARRMTMADIGANLTHSSFREDLDAVLARSRDAGVGTIVVTGTSVEESRHAPISRNPIRRCCMRLPACIRITRDCNEERFPRYALLLRIRA